MRRNEVFRGSFLKAEAMKRPDGKYNTLTLTIKGRPEDHEFDDGKSQRVVSFREDDRKLGLNQTNWDSIADISGKDDDDLWDGTVVVLWVDPKVKFGSGYVPAIRIRAPEGASSHANDLPDMASSYLQWKRQAWNQVLKACGNDQPKALERIKAAIAAVAKGKAEPTITEGEWASIALWDPEKAGVPAGTGDDLPPF